MPGKYSYNAVLSDYSSQGLIPLSNNKQIDYERDRPTATDTPPSVIRSRSHSALKARAPVSGPRIVIQDSDSEGEFQTSVRAQTSQSHRVLHTTHRQPRSDRPAQRKHVRIEKPLPSPPETSTPERRRTGGVRAFIAARGQEEFSALTEPGASEPDLTLREFLNSVPRSPERNKRQPRDDQLAPPKSSSSSHNRDISVREFLNLVPGPPLQLDSAKSTETPKAPVSAGAPRSPLVSRLPKGVELPHRQTRAPTSTSTSKSKSKRQHLQNPLHPEARARSSTPDSKATKARTSKAAETALDPPPKATPALRETTRKLERGQPKKTPPQEHFGEDYRLDFHDFTDADTSYFPRVDHAAAKPATVERVASTRSSIKRSETPRSTKTVLRISERRDKLGVTEARLQQHGDFTATPPISPQDSTFHTDDQLSPSHGSATTYERSVQSPQPPKVEQTRRSSGSWSLPAIKKSESDSNSFCNMFEDRGGRNILIFTSDEEDGPDTEEAEAEEDDLPTPRMQKLEEDVRFPSNEWGMISAGKQFNAGSKDPDNLSDGSAVYPPDIGRHASGNESPLALALQSMQHGGELGASYKPPQNRFALRKTVNPSEILGRLGLKRTMALGDKASTIASSTSGKSRDKARPNSRPASSARGRLPATT